MSPMYPPTLQWHERLYHRDQLRAGRYAALADAEGFHSICFALEALGLRLLGEKAALGKYGPRLQELAKDSIVLTELSVAQPGRFSRFEPLFNLVKSARNDAMHTGVYARHATSAAIELCIGLEEALMTEQQHPRKLVEDFMVKGPVTVEPWQPVAHVRQLMLTHSFSFLPVLHGGWKLISEGAMARYMRSGREWKTLLSATVSDAAANGLDLEDAEVVTLKHEIHALLNSTKHRAAPRLWLVHDDQGRLCGVLSPFELM
jgi:CBS domain-containing protein